MKSSDKQRCTSQLFERESRIGTVTGVILAGGDSSRMKSNKALLPYRGEFFIKLIHRQMASIFPEVIVVTRTPEPYRSLSFRTVPDIHPGKCSLAGIHSGLVHSVTRHIFVVACDMPDLNGKLIRRIATRAGHGDAVIPESPWGLEPLHAVYSKGCLPAMEETLASENKKILSCLDRLMVTIVSQEEIARIDPKFSSFRNINTPEEYFRIRKEESGTDRDFRRQAMTESA